MPLALAFALGHGLTPFTGVGDNVLLSPVTNQIMLSPVTGQPMTSPVVA
jgi:hypothetical protein